MRRHRGIIYRDGSEHAIGDEMTRMLQSMKHRGPDSTGYALYGNGDNGNLVMRYKLADANTPRDFDFEDRLRRHRTEVEARLASLGARILEVDEETPYAFRVSFEYDGDLKLLADFVEDIPEAEVLSLGRSLEIVEGPRRRRVRPRAVRAREVHRHACDRARAHGDRVGGRHRRRASVLGVPVLGRRGRPQRPARRTTSCGAAGSSAQAAASCPSATPRSSPSTSPRR